MSSATTPPSLPPTPLGAHAFEREVIAPSVVDYHTRERPLRKPFPWNTTVVYAILILGSLVLIGPFVWMVKSSLSTEQIVSAGEITAAFGTSIQPVFNDAGEQMGTKEISGPQWQNYPDSLEAMGASVTNRWLVFPALSNTVVITILSIVGQIFSCSLVGFGFARFRFKGRDALFVLMLSTMMLPPQVTMIPVFILFRSIGLIDTFWPLILPAWLASPFFVFMFRQFFAQVPEELMEAARIDGASNFSIYWRMMLPLSGPVIAIVAIYTFMSSWNDFMGPLIYLNSPENRTLALELNVFKGQYGIRSAHLLMAASFLCMLPCIALFFAAQRYFVANVASSGLKG